MNDDRAILREAVRDRHKNETFEKALGRVLRRHHKTYRDYMRVISDVRNRAASRKIDLEEAARELAQS